MRVGSSPALPDDPIERKTPAAKPHGFRAALRTAAKRREDQDDATAGQAAQQQAKPEPVAQKTAGAAAPTSEATNEITADTAIDRTARPTSGDESSPPSTIAAVSGDRTVAQAADVARATKEAANGVEVMTAGSAESASSTALTASIAATLAFATGNAPRAQAAAPKPAEAQPATSSQAIDPMLAATLGFGAPPVAPAPAPAPTAPAKDDPVSALLAAAVSRAVGSFATATNGAASPAPDAAQPVAPTAALPTGLDQIVNLTPLEQAVHELIGKMTDHKSDAPDGKTTATDADLAPFHALASAHLASHGAEPAAITSSAAGPVRAAAPVSPPELPVNSNPSHVHLIVDDGPERVVVTVAMRGNDVHVAMRSADDTTTTALARNAASLDHAMRARGLQLGELTAEREPTDRRQQQAPRDPEPRRDPRAPRFTLEETKP